MKKRHLTKNFTLSEFTSSYTADRLGIENRPTPLAFQNILDMANQLQKLRDALCNHFEEDIAIRVSSGYRCKALNAKLAGAARKSHHILGHAADIHAEGFEPEELVRFIVEHGDRYRLHFDQLINEYDKWVHISFHPDLRGQVLRADRNKLKKTVYTRLL